MYGLELMSVIPGSIKFAILIRALWSDFLVLSMMGGVVVLEAALSASDGSSCLVMGQVGMTELSLASATLGKLSRPFTSTCGQDIR